MPNFAKARRALCRLALPAAVALLALPALAQPMMPDEEMPDPFANSDCAAEPVTGSGPGFSNSREASEDAARKAWGEKATAIYPEATWDTAKDAGVSCVVQGLYSKCFAQAIPCKPKSDEAKSGEAASDDKSMGADEMGAEEAAKAGASGATETDKKAAAPVCKRAMINPHTGVAFCMEPRGATVEAPPTEKLPPCKPGTHRGEAWTFGPACNDE